MLLVDDETRQRVVKLYEAWGKKEKAVEWRNKLGKKTELPANVFERCDFRTGRHLGRPVPGMARPVNAGYSPRRGRDRIARWRKPRGSMGAVLGF
jgi:hypothetical protein